MAYTKQWAKTLSLEVWRYLRDHPSIEVKEQLPTCLWERIKELRCRCPLCEVLGTQTCSGCPLPLCVSERGRGVYANWLHAHSINKRYRAACVIVKRIENWRV